jgi:hypothetical protein
VSNYDRRSFLAYFSSVGLSSTLFPGVLWAKLKEAKDSHRTGTNSATQTNEAANVVITKDMLRDAASVAGLEFTDQQLDKMLAGVNKNLAHYRELRKIPLENAIAPPLYFNPILPGTKIDRIKRPIRMSAPPKVERPKNLGRCVLAGDAARSTDSHEAGDVR